MARDYVVNITGRDNLSSTLRGIRQQLQDTTSSASGLDRIEQRFERIQNSTAPLRRRLRELQGIMAQMNLDGLHDTDVFARIAAEAASYSDSIGDARQAIRLLSSDTAMLDAGIQAFQGLAGAASIATGVMGMLGSENEDVQNAILKVQSAIGVLNGVQAIANTLNQDSILMLKLRQFWESVNARTTVVATTATTANTVVTNANRIATQAWNTVKAISKALLGDFTGLILVGAGALATYAMFTDDSTEADKKNADALKDQKSEAESLADTLSKKLGTETANLTGKYLALRDGWKNCRNEQEKNEFISNNATAFKSLGLNITDVSSAENAFVANTNSVVQALNARAEAAAYAAIQQELYEKAIRQEASVKQQKQKVTTNTRNINNQRARAAGNTKYHDTNNYTTAGIQAQEAEARETRKQAEEMGRKSAEAARKATRLSKKSGAFGSVNTQKTGRKTTGTNRTTRTNRTTDKTHETIDPIAPKGSLADLDNKISKKKQELSFAVKPEDLVRINEELDTLTSQKRYIELYMKEGGKSIQDQVNGSIVDAKVDVSANDLNSLHAKWQQAIEASDEYQAKLREIQEQDRKELLSKQVDAVVDGMSQLSNSASYLNNLGESFDNCSNALDYFSAAINTVVQGFQVYKGVVEAVNTLNELFASTSTAAASADTAATSQEVANSSAKTAASSGEAIASATASGAKMPFPMNLVAIAAGVAAVIAALATISGSFADGGIIQGANTHGDQLLARVNAGEMILNGSQQRNLFNLLDGGTGSNMSGQVEFKISGSALKGVLRNYDNKMSVL